MKQTLKLTVLGLMWGVLLMGWPESVLAAPALLLASPQVSTTVTVGTVSTSQQPNPIAVPTPTAGQYGVVFLSGMILLRTAARKLTN